MEQPAQLNYKDRYEIIRHMRELISLGPLLQKGFDFEWSHLRDLLHQHEFSNDEIRDMEQKACEYTIYEKVLPRPNDGGRDR